MIECEHELNQSEKQLRRLPRKVSSRLMMLVTRLVSGYAVTLSIVKPEWLCP